MKSVRILSHTADVRLLVKANSRQELFTAGLMGIAKMMSPEVKNKKYSYSRKCKVRSADLTSLFVDSMNEILSFNYLDKCIYDYVKAIQLDDDNNTEVEIEVEGYAVSHYKREVKAITYHEAEIKRSGVGLYETIIILDI